MSFDDDDNDDNVFDEALAELLGDAAVAPTVAAPPSATTPTTTPDVSTPAAPSPLDTQYSGPLEESIASSHGFPMHPGDPVIDNTTVLPQIEDTLVQPGPYRDPLIAEMERFAKAAETDGGRHDEFYQYVEARQAAAIANNNSAAQVGNPASIVGKRLGGSVVVFPDIVKAIQSVLSWQADDDSETGPVTVTIAPAALISVQNPATSSLRPFALVTWGSYGFAFTVEMDVGRGLQFTVNASSMQISLGLDADSKDTINGANLAAFISFRTCVRTAPLIRSKYIDSLAQNANTIIAVPYFANNLLPIQMTDTAGQVQLDFIDSKNVIRYTLIISNGSQLAAIPITSEIVEIKVTQLTATTQSIRLPFELSM